MKRIMLVAGTLAMLGVPVADAAEYVPGKTRADGLYIPPHFRAATERVHAVEAWFDALLRQESRHGADKLPSGAAGSPPVPSAPERQ